MTQHQQLIDSPAGRSNIPPLEPGDHLSRTEFERRYDAMPGLKKAELIEGVVFMASPVRLEGHAEPHIVISFWLGAYLTQTPFVRAADNASVRLDDDSMPQPDALLMIDPACGGQAQRSDDDYVAGGTELIIEIAASTASIDLHTKLEIYRRNNVREYLVWRTLDGAIDWFWLEDGEYRRLPVGEDGILRSRIFPGLWLDPSALIARDFARVLGVVLSGLADPAHQAFVARLQAHV